MCYDEQIRSKFDFWRSEVLLKKKMVTEEWSRMCPVASARSPMHKQEMYAICNVYSYDFPKMVFTHKVNNNLHILDAKMHSTEGLTDIKHEQNKPKTDPPIDRSAFAGL